MNASNSEARKRAAERNAPVAVPADTGLRDAIEAVLAEYDERYALSNRDRHVTVGNDLWRSVSVVLAAHPAPQDVPVYEMGFGAAVASVVMDDPAPQTVDDGDCCTLPDGGCPGCSNCPTHCVCAAPPVTVTDAMVERAAKIIDPGGRGTGLDVARRTARAALTAALTEDAS